MWQKEYSCVILSLEIIWKGKNTVKMTTECMFCSINQMFKHYGHFEKDEKKQAKFLKTICAMIANLNDDQSAPELNGTIMNMIADEFGVEDMFKAEKHEYNQAVMEMKDTIQQHIDEASDKLYRALQYAMTGNYIDFGVETKVTKDKLSELVEKAADIDLGDTYEKLKKDLEGADSLVYLLDNCGEIVFDMMCIAEIKELYPKLDITAVVRGGPIYNDVTMVDALETGLADMVSVVDNGMRIPGTLIEKITPQTSGLIKDADVVIAKGMGNFETMIGCSLNVYYMFLCKCKRFEKGFGLPQFSAVLINEKDY